MRKLLTTFAEVALVAAVLAVCVWGTLRFYRPVRVAGGSMRPALVPGDLVFVDLRERARRSQIALLDVPRHGPVLHRVIATEADGSVRTQGDANDVADFSSLPANAVVGPVILVVPIGKLVERWRGVAPYDTMAAQQNSSRQ